MSAKNTTELDEIGHDVALLKRDLSRLMEHMKNGTYDVAKETTQDTVARVSDEVDHLYRGLNKQAGKSRKAIERRIEEQPLTSLLVAFGVGLISGRLLRR